MARRDWLIAFRGRLTQEQVAFLSGISRGAYSNVESGKRDPSVAMAKAIAGALNFEWNIFFDQSSFKTKQKRKSA